MKDKPRVSVIIPTRNRKEKLIRLIDSILKSNNVEDVLEIVVVDDASTDGTYEEIKRRFPQIRIIRNEKNLFLAGSRNKGIKNAKGFYLFLVDDDNVVDKNCISELVRSMEDDFNPPIGICAPIMYYFRQFNRILCAGIKRSMITSLTEFLGRDEIDHGQFNELIESMDFPNAFMVRREVIEKVGMFDEKNFPIHYDEADFGERTRKAGYKIICNPKAKIWHDSPLPEEVDKSRMFNVDNEFRAYFTARNRILFHKKYSKWWQFLIFITIFNWLFTFLYLKVILFNSEGPFSERMKIAKKYIKGISNGYSKVFGGNCV